MYILSARGKYNVKRSEQEANVPGKSKWGLIKTINVSYHNQIFFCNLIIKTLAYHIPQSVINTLPGLHATPCNPEISYSF